MTTQNKSDLPLPLPTEEEIEAYERQYISLTKAMPGKIKELEALILECSEKEIMAFFSHSLRAGFKALCTYGDLKVIKKLLNTPWSCVLNDSVVDTDAAELLKAIIKKDRPEVLGYLLTHPNYGYYKHLSEDYFIKNLAQEVGEKNSPKILNYLLSNPEFKECVQKVKYDNFKLKNKSIFTKLMSSWLFNLKTPEIYTSLPKETFIKAAKYNHTDMLTNLINEPKIKKFIGPDIKKQALFEATITNSIDSVKTILTDPLFSPAPNPQNKDLMCYAVKTGALKVIEYLLTSPEISNPDLNNNQAAVEAIFRNGQIEVLKFVLDKELLKFSPKVKIYATTPGIKNQEEMNEILEAYQQKSELDKIIIIPNLVNDNGAPTTTVKVKKINKI